MKLFFILLARLISVAIFSMAVGILTGFAFQKLESYLQRKRISQGVDFLNHRIRTAQCTHAAA